MANLPRAIQRQVEAAEALLTESNKPPVQEVPPAPAPVDTAPETGIPAPQVEQTTVEVAPKPAVPEETWENRYKSLQGLFNSRVHELQGQNKDLTQKLQQVFDKLDTLERKAPAPGATPQTTAVDPKDVDAFGEDLVQMVQRVTNSVLGSVAQRMDTIVTDFDKRIGSLEAALKGTAQTVAMTAEEMFFDRIGKAIPDWQEVNQSDAFIAWLQEVDPVYGEPRQAALNIAQQNLNAERAIAVFRAFKASIAPASPQPKKTSSLDKQVSPSNVASAPPSAPAAKPIYKQSDIQSFYADVAKGKYRGRDAEVAEIEQLINEAISEGRVI